MLNLQSATCPETSDAGSLKLPKFSLSGDEHELVLIISPGRPVTVVLQIGVPVLTASETFRIISAVRFSSKVGSKFLTTSQTFMNERAIHQSSEVKSQMSHSFSDIRN